MADVNEAPNLTPEAIKALTPFGCIKAAFANGPSGAPVSMADIKPFSKEEREEFGEECRKALPAVAAV